MKKIIVMMLLAGLSVSCDYQSNSETTSLQDFPESPTISPASTYIGESVTVVDPDGRIQAGDILVFYGDTMDPVLDAVIAADVTVINANTISATVPAGLTLNAAYWVSVRPDINDPSRFTDLAFTPLTEPAVSWSQDVFPIMDNYCAGCHSGQRPSADLDLSTAVSAYSGLVNVLSGQCTSDLLVSPGDSSASYLMNKLTGVGMCSGTTMPRGDSMTAAEIDTIRLWIDQGALDN